jgi:type VI secretion system protein VasJ
LKRNPALVDCSYAGGLPFASDETRAWLTEVLGAEDSRVQLARSRDADDESEAFEPGDLERAIELFRAQQSTEAAEVLQQGIRRALGGRSKFRARLDASRACLDANQAERARPMLERLQRDANSLTFETWEQAWAIELLQLLAVCYGRLAKAAKGDDEKKFSEMLSGVLDTLSGIDMQAAAAVQEEIS